MLRHFEQRKFENWVMLPSAAHTEFLLGHSTALASLVKKKPTDDISSLGVIGLTIYFMLLNCRQIYLPVFQMTVVFVTAAKFKVSPEMRPYSEFLEDEEVAESTNE